MDSLNYLFFQKNNLLPYYLDIAIGDSYLNFLVELIVDIFFIFPYCLYDFFGNTFQILYPKL